MDSISKINRSASTDMETVSLTVDAAVTFVVGGSAIGLAGEVNNLAELPHCKNSSPWNPLILKATNEYRAILQYSNRENHTTIEPTLASKLENVMVPMHTKFNIKCPTFHDNVAEHRKPIPTEALPIKFAVNKNVKKASISTFRPTIQYVMVPNIAGDIVPLFYEIIDDQLQAH